MTEFAVNVPTSVGKSKATNLAFCDEISWDVQREFGKGIENLGFDGLSVPDHFMTGNGPTTEALTTVTALATVTEDIALYSKTFNTAVRHGPMLAKAAAEIDNISDGRLKLGLGAGWHEEEARSFGYDWPNAPARLKRLEETIELTKQLWTEDSVTYDGEFFELAGASCKPRPTQSPRPPIMVGGGGEQIMLQIVAKHADVWNWRGSIPVMERKLDVLRGYCDKHHRDFGELEKSWWGRCVIRETEEDLEEMLKTVPMFRAENIDEEWNHLVGTPAEVADDIQRYVDLGFDEIVVEFVDFPQMTGAELFADEVLPQFS